MNKVIDKIDFISKTKNRTGKTHGYKNPIQNISHLLRTHFFLMKITRKL